LCACVRSYLRQGLHVRVGLVCLFFLLSGEPFLDRLVWTLKYKDHGGTGTAIDFEEDKGKASLIVAFFLVGAVALTLERENEYICFRFEYVLRSFFSVSVEQIHN